MRTHLRRFVAPASFDRNRHNNWKSSTSRKRLKQLGHEKSKRAIEQCLYGDILVQKQNINGAVRVLCFFPLRTHADHDNYKNNLLVIYSAVHFVIYCTYAGDKFVVFRHRLFLPKC